MGDWHLRADDVFDGLMVIDLATNTFRLAISADFETYIPISDLRQLQELRKVLPRSPPT
jgi:hypothetical protein